MRQKVSDKIASFKKWDIQKGHSPFSVFLKNVHPLAGDELVKHVDEFSFHHTICKGELLLKVGEISQYVYLLMKGALRAYMHEGKKELTTWINLENSVLTSARGFILQEPSFDNIQALEDCELICINYKDIQFLYEHFIDANIVGRKILEHLYIQAEERAYLCRLTNATKKYTYFIENYGDFLNRIPLKYIASYLAITLETLSRIRSKLGQGSR